MHWRRTRNAGTRESCSSGGSANPASTATAVTKPMASGETLARGAALTMDAADFQRRSDAYTFFDRLGDAIITGPTGTNVRDLRLLLAY